ncbi:MAG TPA: potassium channel family protein [Phycisphaerae bacterium]|jgi:hypothetical protein
MEFSNEATAVESPETTISQPLDAASKLDALRAWEDRVTASVTRNPLESLSALLVGGSALFYAAEKGTNPKVKTFWDALYYITTCASVGYADVFASTQTGKAVAAVVFTFGPSLTAKVFDRPRNEPAALENALAPVVARLDAILAELRRLRA